MSELRRVIAADTTQEAEDHVLCDVVFVHGLRGNPDKTWSNHVNDMTNSGPFWIAEDHPSIAVWSFGYDASTRPNAMPLPQRAEDFLTTLQEKRFGRRPLVLIGHSMGGLLIKHAIHTADGLQEPAWKTIAETIRLLIFVSTPHHGSTLATYLAAVTRIFAYTPVKQLVGREANLRPLNNWFRSYVDRKRPTVASFFETKPTGIVGIVVDEVSADFGFPNHICRPIHDDHSGSSKPLSRESRVAALIAIELEKLFDHTRQPNVSTAVSQVLRYRDDTHIHPDRADSVVGSEGRVGIEYFEEVALTAERLRAVVRNPRAVSGQIESCAKSEIHQRARQIPLIHTQRVRRHQQSGKQRH